MIGTLRPVRDRHIGASRGSAYWSHFSSDGRLDLDRSIATLLPFLFGRREAVSRRSIEMYEYRQALMRMRQSDSEREIARSCHCRM